MIRRTHRTFAVTACLLSLVPLAAGDAVAAEPEKGRAASAATDPAAAQALFYEARTLMQKGKWTEACPKLEESLRLDHGIGTAYNLADCHEHVGKLATAWSGFLDVAAQSKAAGQAQREKVARERAQKLEPRLPRLVVDVRTAPPGLTVERDGVAVGAAAFGTAIPVDPGSHKVVANAPGRVPFQATAEAKEGKTARVVVSDLPLAPAPIVATTAPTPAAPITKPAESPASTTTTTSATALPTTTAFPEPEVERGQTQRTIGWVTLGAGVAGLAAGGYFGLRSLDKRNTSRDNCNGDLCNATGVELRDDAIRAGNNATIAGIAGGAAVVGGLVLVLTAPKDSRRGALPGATRIGRLEARPEVGPFGAGVTLGGTLP